LEREQDHLVDAPLVVTDARTLKRLEDFAPRCLELVPDVTSALQEKRVARVDHYCGDLVLDDCLASNGRIERADDDLPEGSACDRPRANRPDYHRLACGADGKAVLLLEVDRGRPTVLTNDLCPSSLLAAGFQPQP